MPHTIKDVAKKAKVSTATVSLVIHDNRRISERTRKKVLRAIKDLAYQPSKIARGLVLQETKNIGFILTDDHFLKTEPFYTHIFLGTEFEARDKDYYVLLNTIPGQFKNRDCLPRFVKENNVDGVIIAGKVPDRMVACLKPSNLPLVFVDYYPSFGDYFAVLIDNLKGGQQATEYLISLGHKQIAFLGGDLEHPSIRDRFQGYRVALENHNILYNPKIVITSESSSNRECGYHAAQRLFQENEKFSAVFACNDAMALGAIQFIKSVGKLIPRDISIIGFDDVDAALTSDPPLTSVSVPKTEMGAQAMKIMVDVLNKNNKKPHKILIPVDLVVRESTMKIV